MADKKTSTKSDPPATNDAYTGMLGIALLALIGGCVLLYLDYSQYSEKAPPPPTKAPPSAVAPKDGAPKDGAPKDGGAKDGGPKDGGAKDGGAKDGGAKDGAPKGKEK